MIPAPAGLDAQSKKLWRLTQKQLTEQGTWEESDAQTLERYVRALQDAREARKAIGSNITVLGSTGQEVMHPGFKAAAEADLRAHKFAQALLLTPQMRQRHQISAVKEQDELENLLT